MNHRERVTHDIAEARSTAKQVPMGLYHVFLQVGLSCVAAVCHSILEVARVIEERPR